MTTTFFSGIIQITVIEGIDLPPMNSDGTCDPFIRYGDHDFNQMFLLIRTSFIVKCLCMLHPHKYNMLRRRSLEEAMIINSWTATLVATYKNCVVMWHHPELSDCSWVTSSLKRRWYPQPWIQNGGRALSFATSIRQATSFRVKSKFVLHLLYISKFDIWCSKIIGTFLDDRGKMTEVIATGYEQIFVMKWP